MHRWELNCSLEHAKDAYWYNDIHYALAILQEVAQEEINVDVQETFDPYCQPFTAKQKEWWDDQKERPLPTRFVRLPHRRNKLDYLWGY